MGIINQTHNKENKTFIKGSNKVPSDLLNKIGSGDRIIMTGVKDFVLNHDKVSQDLTLKPRGLWYSFGDEWVRWVKDNMPEWENPYLYKVTIDTTNILTIDVGNIHSFFKKYRSHDKISWMIDWKKVAKDYKGIDIPNYHTLGHLRHDMNFMWIYSLDVSSGCIWDVSAIKNVEILR